MKKRWFLTIIVFLIFTLLAPPAGALPTIVIQGVPYIPINFLSQERGFQFDWDPVLKNATVRGSIGFVKFHVGSEYILSQGKLFKLSDKVRYFNGSVVAPLPAAEYLDKLGPVGASFGAKTGSFIPQHRILKVAIDAGHGGQDFGAMSKFGLKEKGLTFEMAGMVRDLLQQRGIDVVMTRTGDYFMPLEMRARVASQKGADFFVSIHANASSTPSLQGFEVYYLSEETDDEAIAIQRSKDSVLGAIQWDLRESENRRESLRLADCIADSVQGSIQISNRRIKAAGFYVLKWVECPAVLVEMGYITNPEDAKRLEDPAYRQSLAQAIVQGIMNFKAEFENADGYTR